MELNTKEKAEELVKDWKKWEDCIRSFIQANHLTNEFDEHVENWNTHTKLPLSVYERDVKAHLNSMLTNDR